MGQDCAVYDTHYTETALRTALRTANEASNVKKYVHKVHAVIMEQETGS